MILGWALAHQQGNPLTKHTPGWNTVRTMEIAGGALGTHPTRQEKQYENNL